MKLIPAEVLQKNGQTIHCIMATQNLTGLCKLLTSACSPSILAEIHLSLILFSGHTVALPTNCAKNNSLRFSVSWCSTQWSCSAFRAFSFPCIPQQPVPGPCHLSVYSLISNSVQEAFVSQLRTFPHSSFPWSTAQMV